MALAVATTSQYVFKRDYAEKRWVNVDANDRACRVQVLKKNNDFTFKVMLEGGGRIEHQLAKDNQLHISNGFIQVPLSGQGTDLELYGIKFKDDTDAQAFYAKIVKEMGQPWVSQRTSVGDDQLPQPFQQAPQTFSVAGTAAPSSQQFQTLPPTTSQAGGPPLVASGVHLPPSMQQQPAAHVQNPRNQLGNQQQLSNQLRQYTGPVRAGYNYPDYSYQQQQPNSVYREQTVREDPKHYNVGMNGNQGMNVQGIQGMNMQGAQGMNMQGAQGMNMQGPQGMNMQGAQGMNMQGAQGMNQGMNLQGTQGMNMLGTQGMNMQGTQGMNMLGTQGMNMQGAQGMNMQRGQGMNMQGVHMQGVQGVQGTQGMNMHRGPANPGLPVMGGAQKKKPQPQNFRKQTAPKPSEMSTVTDSLMSALNRGETENAKHLFDVLLMAVANPEHGNSGLLKISIDKSSIPAPKPEKTFVLGVHMEFQSPRRDPMDIFLDVTADKTIMDLQYEVERKFYVPRASQNWIIGPRLVKNTDDLGKTLKDFGITGVGVSTVDVCMYVMHTKKANVPKEEFEALRNRQQQTQKMQQNVAIEEQRAMQNQAAFPQGQAQLVQHQQQLHQGQVQVSHSQGVPQQYNQQQQQQQMNDPLYDKLGNRGYSGGQQQQQQQQQQQFQQQPLDPTYSRLDVYQQGGGQPDRLMNASSPSQQAAALPQGNSNLPLRARDPGMYHTDGSQPNALPNQPQNLQQQQSSGIPNGAHQQQQPQQPTPVVEELKVGWSCTRCTFINRPRRPGCEQCGENRPADYVIPDDCPVEEFEREALENEKLFDEYEVKEKERKEQEALENYRKLMEAEEAQLTTNTEAFECMICYSDVEPGEGVILKGCVHQFCKDCLHHTVINSEEAEVKCPFDDGEYTCGAVISEREIRAVCTEEEVKAVHKRGLAQAENAAQNSFHCRSPNCEGFCFIEDDVNEFRCPVCYKPNCLVCKAIHEEMNCQEYQDDIKRRAANDEAAQATQKMLEDLVLNGEAMNCPACKIIVQKKDGCDWIRCSMCKTEICWATKGPRWGPNGKGDVSGGCKCRVGGKKCTPLCRNCH